MVYYLIGIMATIVVIILLYVLFQEGKRIGIQDEYQEALYFAQQMYLEATKYNCAEALYEQYLKDIAPLVHAYYMLVQEDKDNRKFFSNIGYQNAVKIAYIILYKNKKETNKI